MFWIELIDTFSIRRLVCDGVAASLRTSKHFGSISRLNWISAYHLPKFASLAFFMLTLKMPVHQIINMALVKSFSVMAVVQLPQISLILLLTWLGHAETSLRERITYGILLHIQPHNNNNKILHSLPLAPLACTQFKITRTGREREWDCWNFEQDFPKIFYFSSPSSRHVRR